MFWAQFGVIEKCFKALDLRRLSAVRVEGEPIDATHYMAEEIIIDIAKRMSDFFCLNTSYKTEIAK